MVLFSFVLDMKLQHLLQKLQVHRTAPLVASVPLFLLITRAKPSNSVLYRHVLARFCNFEAGSR